MIQSYRLALDFFGFALVDVGSGELTRTPAYQARFANLNSKSHNYLRITRILKWLGEFNVIHFQPHFIRALSRASFEPPYAVWDMRRSIIQYFVPVLKDKD